MNDTKICPRCQNEKTLDEYTKKRGTFGWLCKACFSKYVMEHRKRNPNTHAKWLEGVYEWKRNNPDKMLAQRQRHYGKYKKPRKPRTLVTCSKCGRSARGAICGQCGTELKRRDRVAQNRRERAARKAEETRIANEIKRTAQERKRAEMGIVVINGETMRRCKDCKILAPIDECKSGRCYDCYRVIENERDRIYWQTHPHKRRAKDHKKDLRRRNIHGSHTDDEWLDLLASHGFKCAKCGSLDDVTRDHIFPTSLGGSDDISNIQPLCRKCNSKKSNKIPDIV